MFLKAPVKRFNEPSRDQNPPLGTYDPKFLTDVAISAQSKVSKTAIDHPRSKPNSRAPSPSPTPRRPITTVPKCRAPLSAIHTTGMIPTNDKMSSELESKYAEVSRKLETLKKESKKLQSQQAAKLKDLNTENVSLQTHISNMESKEKENLELLQKLSVETEALAFKSKQISSLEKELLQWKEVEIPALNSTIADLKLSFEEIEKKHATSIDKLKKENATLLVEVMKENIKEIEKHQAASLEVKKEEVSSLEKIKKEHASSLDIIEKKHAASLEELKKEHSKEIEKIENEHAASLEECSIKISQLQSNLDSFQEEFEKMSANNDAAEKEIKLLKDSRQEISDKLEEKSSQLTEMIITFQDQVSMWQESDKKNLTLQQDIADLKEKHEKALGEKFEWGKREEEILDERKCLKGHVKELEIALVAEKNIIRSFERKFNELKSSEEETKIMMATLKNNWKEKEDYLIQEIETMNRLLNDMTDATPKQLANKEIKHTVKKSNDSLVLQKDFSVLKEAIEKEKSAAELDLIGQSCLIEQQHNAVVMSPEKAISPHKEDIVESSSASAKLDFETLDDFKVKVQSLRNDEKEISEKTALAKENLEKTKLLINSFNSVSSSQADLKSEMTGGVITENKLPGRKSGSLKLTTIVEEDDDAKR